MNEENPVHPQDTLSIGESISQLERVMEEQNADPAQTKINMFLIKRVLQGLAENSAEGTSQEEPTSLKVLIEKFLENSNLTESQKGIWRQKNETFSQKKQTKKNLKVEEGHKISLPKQKKISAPPIDIFG